MKKEKQLKVLKYLERDDIVVNRQGDLWFYVKTQDVWRKKAPTMLPSGYSQYVLVMPNGERVIVYRHILSYMAFTRSVYPEKYHIDHIDRNIANAKWENLRCVTARDNRLNQPERGATKDSWNRIYTKDMQDILRLHKEGKNMSEIGRILGFHRLGVSRVIKKVEAGLPMEFSWGKRKKVYFQEE